jgi:hypothetical protein
MMPTHAAFWGRGAGLERGDGMGYHRGMSGGLVVRERGIYVPLFKNILHILSFYYNYLPCL